MKKVVLISCVSMKLDRAARAEDLYISPLFRLNLAYARSLKPDKIFILSALYGLVRLDQVIEPYEKTLNTMKTPDIQVWADQVMQQLRSEIDCEHDEVIFLAGERYRKYLMPWLANIQIPLKGLGIGRQLQYLKDHAK